MTDVVHAIFSRKDVQRGPERPAEDAPGYVFMVKGRSITPGYLSHRFKRAVKGAGHGGRLHFHGLRHTFASWLVQSGASLYVTQQLMGHSSPYVTQVYRTFSPKGCMKW